jgi:serine/threonine protein kinase
MSLVRKQCKYVLKNKKQCTKTCKADVDFCTQHQKYLIAHNNSNTDTPHLGINTVLNNQWRIINILSDKKENYVFRAVDIISNINVIIKTEIVEKHLYVEYQVYKKLMDDMSVDGANADGFPTMLYYGKMENFENYIMLVLTEEGRSVHELKKTPLTLNNIINIGLKAIDLIETLHKHGIIHADIKPGNFTTKEGKLYMIDFGMSHTYLDDYDNHVSYRDKQHFKGTFIYASYNTHCGVFQTRRDDLEALGFMILDMIYPLPWRHLTNNKDRKNIIKDMKKTDKIETLIKHEALLTYMNYVRELDFNEEPDYQYVKSLLQKLIIKC